METSLIWIKTSTAYERLSVSMQIPEVFILREVLIKAKSVAWKDTVPSLVRGIFMATSFFRALRIGQQLPKPRGGLMPLNSLIKASCFMWLLKNHWLNYGLFHWRVDLDFENSSALHNNEASLGVHCTRVYTVASEKRCVLISTKTGALNTEQIARLSRIKTRAVQRTSWVNPQWRWK